MEIDILKILGEWGSAGAVIFVVWLFLRSTEKRDQEWKDFFTALNGVNTRDMKMLTEAMKGLIAGVKSVQQDIKEHDSKMDDHFNAVKDQVTQPRKPRQTKGQS